MHRIVIFASGSGSNALNLIEHFNSGNFAKVLAVFTNKKDAGVIEKAQNKGVEVHRFNRADFYETDAVIQMVASYKPDVIVLAGFLWLVPASFIESFEGIIINLHPSLLPKYGGKGMYGRFVHEAVLNANEKESGISIHIVNTEFDKGELIYQDKFPIFENDTIADVEAKIHELEYKGLPLAVEQFLKK